jgi:ribosomal protein L37E
MLVWVTLAAGFVVIVLGSLAVMRVDRRWRRSHLQCCRCLDTWHGRAKICARCGGRGNAYDWLAVRYAGFPSHDWQGYLDTGPIPVISITDVEIPAQRTPVPAERAEALSDR